MIVRALIVCVLLAGCGLVHAQNAVPSDVQVKLSLAENKTVYRIGEPIKLVLEFATNSEGYSVEIVPDKGQPGSDTIVISPESGVTYWLNELSDNRLAPRHAFGYETLTSAPIRLEFALNDTVRFDEPGRYTVTVTTRRLIQRPNHPVVLATNPVVFEIKPMSDQEEEKELKRLGTLLDAGRGNLTSEPIAAQLSYLTGDPSTREKVRRFLADPERNGGGHGYTGLFIARNRALALKLLEAALNDPTIPVTVQLLYTVTRLKTLIVHGVQQKPTEITWFVEGPEHPRAAEIRDAYVVQVAAGLSKRTGKNQTTTALTIVLSLAKNNPAASAILREVRTILVQQFDTLTTYSHEWLLREHWELIRDPSLVPALKRLMSSGGRRHARAVVLQRLTELAPDEARSYLLAEIRDPSSRIDPEFLTTLNDKSLPEVEATLLDQLRKLAAQRPEPDFAILKQKTALLVRYATENVYQDVLELYRDAGVKLPRDGRAGLLAYLLKHNEGEAIPLIEEAVAELKPNQSPMLLTEITKLYYSEALEPLLHKLLETDDPVQASHAAYLLGKHGSGGAQRFLEARLNRWRTQWRDRVAEANEKHQGLVERELIGALTNGKSWQLSPERVKELKLSCLTEVCKRSIRIE